MELKMTKEEFEKEAEERARKLKESQTLGVYDSDEELAHDVGWNAGEVSGYEDGFNDGAEYVYNKCNVKLTKAKEILRKFLDAKSIEETCVAESEAEQFLKECGE